MRNQHYFFTLLLVMFFTSANAQTLKPYILGIESTSDQEQLKAELKTQLNAEGIDVLGEYSPAEDPDRWIMVISSEELIDAVKQVNGLAAFAATLRIAITREEGKHLVSYTNPSYWGNAYFRTDFSKVESNYKSLESKITNALKKIGDYQGTAFGSEKGVEIEDLRKYRYMFGMPRFDDTVELGKFSSYDTAISKIEANIKVGKANITPVYAIEIPGQKLKLYGFALLGEDGESSFLPKIDITNPKHTAFLPYEALVVDGKVFMLHGRYRIALSFPDLTMGTFTKIMSTPGDIKDLLKTIAQ